MNSKINIRSATVSDAASLLEKLENLLKAQGVLNVYAGTTYIKKEDEYLTHASPKFHKKMGYKKVAEYHQCGFKFNCWYGVMFMEKMIGEHTENPKEVEKWSRYSEL